VRTPIAGAFMFGVIMPKGELKDILIEKVEDFVSRFMMQGPQISGILMQVFVCFRLWLEFENHIKIPEPARTTRPTRTKNPNRTARIPAGFSHFPYYYGLENSKPDGHGSGGRMGQNPSDPTRAQP
jgi:hypothetical protein